MIANYFSFSLLIGGAVAVLSAWLIYLRDKNSAANRAWFWMNVAAAIWSFGYFKMITASSKEIAWISNWALHSAAIFVPVTYFHFVLALTDDIKNRKYKILLNLAYFIGIVFLFLNPTKLFVRDVIPKFIFNFVCDAGPLYIYFTLHFWLWSTISTFVLFSNYLKRSGIIKEQLKYVLLAEIGFIGGGSVFFLTFNINIPPYPIILFSLYPLIIDYAITRYRLMGVKVVFSKIFFYTLATIFLVVTSYAAVFIHVRFFGSPLTWGAFALAFPMAFLVAYSFRKFSDLSERWSDSIFYQGRNPQKIINDLIVRTNQTADIVDLSQILIKELKTTLALKSLSIVLFFEFRDQDNLIINREFSFLLSPDPTFWDVLKKYKDIVILDEDFTLLSSKDARVFEALRKDGVAAVIPLIHRKEVVGVLLSGEENGGNAYTKEEVEFLKIVSSQISVAFVNAYTHDNLEYLVSEQISDITEKNKRLEELLKMKSDFLRVVNHQLNTPLSIMRNAFSLMEEGILPPKKGMEIFASGLARISNTIHDFWDAFEMEGQKMKCQMEKVDIMDMVKKAVEEKKKLKSVIDRKLKLRITKPDFTLPPVSGDPKTLPHAISNLLDNAVFYTLKGKIEVSFEKTAYNNRNFIKVNISDTGSGIDEEDQKRLFAKFSRGQQASKIYQDGSGLGLYIAQRIIDGHGGELKLEKTVVGEGTTFSFTLLACE